MEGVSRKAQMSIVASSMFPSFRLCDSEEVKLNKNAKMKEGVDFHFFRERDRGGLGIHNDTVFLVSFLSIASEYMK